MQCSRGRDEELAAQKMDVLYGEADAQARSRLEAHLAECAVCREEMAALGQLRRSLKAWTLDDRKQTLTVARPRPLPVWLAAAAGLILGVGAGVIFTSLGHASLRGEIEASEGRALERERQYREEVTRLRLALEDRPVQGSGDLLERVDRRVDEAVRRGQAAQDARLDAAFAEWSDQLEAQRRVDMARVAAGLSYLDGQHGQQVARTNELMSYVLDATEGDRR